MQKKKKCIENKQHAKTPKLKLKQKNYFEIMYIWGLSQKLCTQLTRAKRQYAVRSFKKQNIWKVFVNNLQKCKTATTKKTKNLIQVMLQKKSLAQEVRQKSDISERRSKGWR